MLYGINLCIAYLISMLSFQVPAKEEVYLLPRKPAISFNTGLLVIGCLLLFLSGCWLLSTIFWLHRPPTQQPHRHPPPAPAPRPDSKVKPGLNDTVPQACGSIPENWKFDCYPEREVVVTRELCEARNCCFIPASARPYATPRPSGRNGVPWCFYPPDFPSYVLVSLNDTSMGKKGTLVREVKTYYPADILTLNVEVLHETDTRLRVRVSEHLLYIYIYKTAVLCGTCVELCKLYKFHWSVT